MLQALTCMRVTPVSTATGMKVIIQAALRGNGGFECLEIRHRVIEITAGFYSSSAHWTVWIVITAAIVFGSIPTR